ncbi:MAG: hypothetical protein ACLVBP_02740 [Ruminococcus sp.]
MEALMNSRQELPVKRLVIQMEMKHYKKQSQVVYNKKNGVEKPWLIRYNFHI